ncbi:hypothetical protein BIY37_09965 [Candidatus Brocadia sapporoensis]|uniref:DUF11 domain-containing protein n=1 Tax=Candidatus Brocadia sapporoensis TaxID=392547 RepID=A0A1V6LYD3_9BACT|nr:DUF11 domain-containing protein [Candidatus Brocadia sapporoensis]MDG6004792.1 DUF11 domain-containing protein [Candidatus Brocadia sp.]OQD45140.1 hypothetical protein BIY37_09965 [Candidatus Brocadia sapporoensis]GJQ22861.1 MAG: large cysteine-rich periplasmic protein OmcB [Candidatus Brocadia sapporoensis]
MSWQKRRNLLISLFFLGVFSIYGCSYQQSAVLNENPPYAHGHIEEDPGQRHKRLHAGSGKVAPEKRESSRTFSAINKKYGIIFIEKKAPPEIQVGKPFDYIIKITNISDEKVKDVEITETFSYKYKLRNSIPKFQKGQAEGTARWFVGDLEPNEMKEIRVNGVSLETGDMPFCTNVTYNLPPLCLITNVVEPKLTITKRIPTEVLFCDEIPITLVVSNVGTGIAQNVQAKESLPQGLKTLDGKSDIVQEIGMLRAGESREIAFTAKAERTGKFSNFATVVAEGGLQAESNTTTTVVIQPVLAITKKGPERIYTGRDINYSIEVSNKGDGPATSTVLEDAIPGNATFVNANQGGILSGNTVRWNLGTLLPNDSTKVSVTLKDKGLGEIKNTATVKAMCANPVSATVITDVIGIAAILLEVIDIADPIEVGENETYEIAVTNQGSDYSTNIKIYCTLEDTMQYISSAGPTKGTFVGNTVIFDPLPSLAPKATTTWKVVVKALSPGDVRFKVEMIEDCLKRPVEETEATNFYK